MMDGYGRMAKILKSLGHPIRLQMIEILGEEGEACVCHLEHLLGLRQAYISQQLAKLREAGVVNYRRDGLNIYYFLRGEKPLMCVKVLKELAIDISGSGEVLKFERSQKKTRGSCPCPRCQAKPSSYSTLLAILKERIMGTGR
jgi:DNA-binding transcriptional ArsR family regulator